MVGSVRVTSGASTLMSVAHAGGQGKTTLAQLLYLASKADAVTYKMCAADFVDESGRSKLGKLYPNQVTDFGPGARLTLARTQNNANAPLRYWDALGPILLQGGSIIDVGANVIAGIVEWGADRNVASLMERRKAPGVDLFCICRAQKHALDDMHTLIKSVTKDQPFLVNRIVVVKNEVGGPFYSTFETGLRNSFPDRSLSFMELRACQAEIWPAIERQGVSLETVLSSDEDQLMSLLEVDLWTASAGLAEIRAWIEHSLRTLRELDLFGRSHEQRVVA